MSTVADAIDTAISRMVIAADEYDRQLVDNCRPAAWVNPRPQGRYNLVVAGAGPAGLVAALGAAGLGARVALVERALTGGDCLNVGCVPSKAVLRAARAVYDARGAGEFGASVAPFEVDFEAAMRRVRQVRANLSRHDSVQRLRDLGVDVYLGEARFATPASLVVADETLEFSRAVIATGARPKSIDVPGLVECGYHTNETIFTVTERPRHLIVIGAGPIGCELGQAFSRLGSRVTMVTDGGRILPREEPGAALAVHRQLEREGISMLCGTRVVRARREGGDVILSVEQEGAESEVCGDTVLVAVGRTPNVEGLDLEAARVEYDSRGVKVDSLLRTSNRRVFAAGDVCSDFKFTHAADAMARVVLANALFKLRCKAGDLLIPRCTYTDPEVAQVGLSEEAARRTGVDAASIRVEMNSNDRALIDGESEGFTAVVYDKRSRRLLGGTIVARHAGEMIGELTLAVRTRRRIGDLAGTIHPYPTQAESLKRAGDTFRRNCLTASKRQWLAHWFRWTR